MTTAQMTVAEIAAGSLVAVRLFERLGIDYCCGGKRPLDEVCREKGLDSAAVRRQLDAAKAESSGDTRDWTTSPVGELIEHIVSVHHGYLRRELPALSARVEKVHRVYTARGQGDGLAGLPQIYEALRAELESHIEKEENVLFPALETCGPELIRTLEREHESAGGALAGIREITRNYAVPEYACVTYRAMLAGLKELEQDLHMHIHLENNVLFPRVTAASMMKEQ